MRLRVKEAAAELGISVSLVYALVARGRLRAERHGLGRGTIRIPPEALDEYRKACTAGGAPAAAPAVPRPRTIRLRHLEA